MIDNLQARRKMPLKWGKFRKKFSKLTLWPMLPVHYVLQHVSRDVESLGKLDRPAPNPGILFGSGIRLELLTGLQCISHSNSCARNREEIRETLPIAFSEIAALQERLQAADHGGGHGLHGRRRGEQPHPGQSLACSIWPLPRATS